MHGVRWAYPHPWAYLEGTVPVPAMSAACGEAEFEAGAAPVLCAVLQFLRDQNRERLATGKQVAALQDRADGLERQIKGLQHQINELLLRLATCDQNKRT